MNDILFEVQDDIGHITLKRSKALNALTLEMIEKMGAQLDIWADDPDIKAVQITGEGKAFCAGGDVKATALGPPEFQAQYFRQEYRNNHRIYHYSKPYISILDGIVMGGGVGISWYGAQRVVTENTVFAMPETGIGLFPDVGTAYMLSRCPGEVGTYLGLTGARLGAVDCLYLGFGTQFVASEDIPSFIKNVIPAKAGILENVEVTLESLRPDIDMHFKFNSIEDIFGSLEKDKGAWANETLETLNRMSPTSLKLTLAHLRRAKTMTFDEVLINDYRLSQFCMQHSDFKEGVRALLIDKDNAPQWAAALNNTEIERAFAALGEKDLVF